MVSNECPEGDSRGALEKSVRRRDGSERADLLCYTVATAIKSYGSGKSRVYEKKSKIRSSHQLCVGYAYLINLLDGGLEASGWILGIQRSWTLSLSSDAERTIFCGDVALDSLRDLP